MRNTGLKTQDATVTNRTLGDRFESDFCTLLYNKGFWSHRLTQNSAGQPADVIAVRNGKAWLIDCKVCTDNRFPLSRIEDNQNLAMTVWKDYCGNDEAWFALRVQDDKGVYWVYMIPHSVLKVLAETQSSLSYEDITKYGTEFGKWVQKCE